MTQPEIQERIRQIGTDVKNRVRTFYGKSGLDEKVQPYVSRYQTLPAEKRENVSAGIVIGTMLLCLVFILWPTIGGFVHNRGELRAVQDEIASAKRDIANMALTRQANERAREMLTEINERILLEDDLSGFLDKLSLMARESKIHIEALKPLALAQYRDRWPRSLPQDYHLAGFEIRATAGYHQLGDFIARLENYGTFVQIKDVEILHKPKVSERQHQVTIRVQLIQKG